jgi:UDP-N-acetylglucosamine 1-carboxyvinyltransferase
MEKLVIEGGTPLNGSIRVSGAKNAALPILFATLLAPGEHRLSNVPRLSDTSSTLSLFGRIGCPSLGEGTVRLDTTRVAYREAPYEVVRRMRASVLVLGPLLARCGEAKVSMPGGCAIGTRPIDEHLRGLEALGCKFKLDSGYIYGTCGELVGADIYMRVPFVTGTENILMAAVLARGRSTLHNAAKEPEVVDLANFLNSLGANVQGAGTDTIVIDGVPRLSPASRPYRILPDRIEAGTYLAAAAAAGGEIELTETDPELLGSTLAKLTEAGCDIETHADRVVLRRTSPLKPFNLRTAPHPGLPTDMQAQLMALACLADGTSTIEETVFENRFMHVAELRRMGADIECHHRTAVVRGGTPLQPASVMASDLRASAALVIAALATQGLSQVLRIYHLDRGYEDLVQKLQGVGARIARVSDDIEDREQLLAALDA